MNIEELYQIYLQYPVVCTDSRKAASNSLFFALKGDNFDGNLFAHKAIEGGCAFAIVDSEQAVNSEQYIVVDDVLNTLQLLANYHRKQLNIPILAITGTNGKTTTKELIGKVLAQKYNLGITSGNLNNHIGVPLTLLGMNEKTEFGVVEMGANHIGEIADLCSIAEPDYGLITNVGKAHLEGFGSLEGVKTAKGELYDYLCRNNGIAFINTDDDILKSMISKYDALKKQNYSASTYNVELMPTNNNNPFLHFKMNGNLVINTNLIGEYNLNNFLAAYAIGAYFNVETAQIIDALKNYQPNNNRSQLIKTKHNTLYMDAYNANPTSMGVAISNFSKLDEHNKLLILGDMLELGVDSVTEHEHIISLLEKNGFEHVWLVGNCFQKTSDKNKQYNYFANVDEVISYLKKHPVQDYTILIKGSNGIHLERLKENL